MAVRKYRLTYMACIPFPLDSRPLQLGVEHRSLDLMGTRSRVGSIGWVREKPEARLLVRRCRQQVFPTPLGAAGAHY